MKKGSVVVWIVAMLFIATGVAFSPSSAQANDLNSDQKNIFFCDQFKQPSDKVHKVSFRGIKGDYMNFSVDLSVDPAHEAGMDNVKRLKTMRTRDGNLYWEKVGLQEVRVAVLPYDRDGKRLWRGYALGIGPKSGRDTNVSTSAILASGIHLSQVGYLLVAVGETGITAGNWGIERSNGFHFCKVLKYANVHTGGATSHVGREAQNPRVVGKIMSKRNLGIVYTHYDDGFFLVGEVLQAGKFGKRERYKIPIGKYYHDIVGMAMAPNERVYTWFKDWTFCAGTPQSLSFDRNFHTQYSLPPGKTPHDIVGMAMAPDYKVYVWFRDGKFCIGTPDDLDKHSKKLIPYEPKFNNKPPDYVHGMAMDNRGVITWTKYSILYGKPHKLDQDGFENLRRLIGGM